MNQGIVILNEIVIGNFTSTFLANLSELWEIFLS